MENPRTPSELPENAIKEFQELMRRHCGLQLSMEDATYQAKRLMAMFAIVFQPIPAK